MLKVKTFNNGIIKVEEDGSVQILHCSSSYDIKWSLEQYKFVSKIVEEFVLEDEKK